MPKNVNITIRPTFGDDWTVDGDMYDPYGHMGAVDPYGHLDSVEICLKYNSY